MSKDVPFSMGGISGVMTVSTLNEVVRIGDVYRCTRSAISGRVGELFPIRSRVDAEQIEFLDSYGDQFERVTEGDGKRIKMK